MINEERDMIIKNLLQSDMDLDGIAKVIGYSGTTRKARIDSLRKYCNRRKDLRDLYALKSGRIQREESHGTEELLRGFSENIIKIVLELAIESKDLRRDIGERISSMERKIDTLSSDSSDPFEKPKSTLIRPEEYDFIPGEEVRQTSIRIWSKAFDTFDEFARENKVAGSKWELMSMALEEFVKKYS